MKKILIIGGIILAVIGVLWLAYYYLIYKPAHPDIKEGERCTTDDGKIGSVKNGVCVPVPSTTVPPPLSELPFTPPIGFRSTKVNESDTASVSLGVFNQLAEATVSSFNILASPVKVTTFIHYETNFSNGCPQYIWYQQALYTKIGEKIDSTSGIKTCYYGFNKSVLPNELKIMVSTLPCTQFKYYLSGVEYSYSKSTQEQGIAYCYYNKQ